MSTLEYLEKQLLKYSNKLMDSAIRLQELEQHSGDSLAKLWAVNVEDCELDPELLIAPKQLIRMTMYRNRFSVCKKD